MPGDRNLDTAVRTSHTYDSRICFVYHFSSQVTMHPDCQKHQGWGGRDTAEFSLYATSMRNELPRTWTRLEWRYDWWYVAPEWTNQRAGRWDRGCRLRGSVGSVPVFGIFRVHGSRSQAPVLVNSVDWQEAYKLDRLRIPLRSFCEVKHKISGIQSVRTDTHGVRRQLCHCPSK